MRQQLEEHLSILQRERVIQGWHRGMISPGKEWKSETDNNLKSADIILLLISSKFTASDYHWGDLMKQAMKQHTKKISRIIIIQLRPVDNYWMKAMFPKVKVLPDNGRPITEWKPYDKAFKNIAEGIRKEAEELTDPIYHIKKVLQNLWEIMMSIVKPISNAFIYLTKKSFFSFINLSNSLRSRRYRRSNKILVKVIFILSGIFMLFILQSHNISEIFSSEPSVITRSESSPIISSTQIRNSTGWIRIGKVNTRSGSLTDGEPLLETSISPPIIPSLQSVVTVKYEVDLNKEKYSSSKLLQKLKPGEKVTIFNVESMTKSGQNSPFVEVMAQVRKCNQTCNQ